MSDRYVWIEENDQAEVMSYEEIIRATEEGRKPKQIFLTKQEMLLKHQLVVKAESKLSTGQTTAPSLNGITATFVTDQADYNDVVKEQLISNNEESSQEEKEKPLNKGKRARG